MDTDPSPTDFITFLPWACMQLNVESTPIITRVEQMEYSAGQSRQRSKENKPTTQTVTNGNEDINSDSYVMKSSFRASALCYIQAVYDSKNNLVQIKFHKNTGIPRDILKIMSLILPFYEFVKAIHINGGLQHDGLYELTKIITTFNITEIVLDDTVLAEAKYYSLLESNFTIKYLSLARCKLIDDDVKEIAQRLMYPLAASQNLSVLNLSSNKITDAGAKHLADMLRSNGQLAYLNLSGNMITDTGADYIFNSLMKFPLTAEEKLDKAKAYTTYLKQRRYLDKRNKAKRSICIDSKSQKKKENKSMPISAVTSGRSDMSSNNELDITGVDEPFKYPLRTENTVVINKIVYCLGNNTLCYLSLAYNNLSYLSVKKLYNVLCAQDNLKRSPKGLVNVCIEGNNIPESCEEMKAIDNIIDNNFYSTLRSSIAQRKKAPLKSK